MLMSLWMPQGPRLRMSTPGANSKASVSATAVFNSLKSSTVVAFGASVFKMDPNEVPTETGASARSTNGICWPFTPNES